MKVHATVNLDFIHYKLIIFVLKEILVLNVLPVIIIVKNVLTALMIIVIKIFYFFIKKFIYFNIFC